MPFIERRMLTFISIIFVLTLSLLACNLFLQNDPSTEEITGEPEAFEVTNAPIEEVEDPAVGPDQTKEESDTRITALPIQTITPTTTPINSVTPTATPVSPGSRAHSLREQGYTATEIAHTLIEEYGTTQDELLSIFAAEGYSVQEVYLVLDSLAEVPPGAIVFVRLLHEYGFPPAEIAQVLIDEYVSVIDELVLILEKGGFSAHDVFLVLNSGRDSVYPPSALIRELHGYYPPVEITQVLLDEYASIEDELIGLLVENGFSARDFYHVLVDLYAYNPADARQALRTHGYTPSQVVNFLVEEFGMDAQGAAQVLRDDGYGIDEISDALKFSLALDALSVAQILKDSGGSVEEVSTALQVDFSLNTLMATQILKAVGFNSRDTYQALKEVYGLDADKARQNLADAGFSEDEIFDILAQDLAVRFAPHLRFDNSSYLISPTIHYPMSAQTYFEEVIAGSGPNISNTDPNSITSSEVPTYWKATRCGNQIRIFYWWFYGRQDTCDGVQGAHDGDWEHIMIILSEDMTRIAAVTFYQHTGMYTRIGGRSGFVDLVDDTHTVVYVGRQAHGSYHYIAYDQHCCYWADSRNGNYPRLKTWENLVELRPGSEGGEDWMDADLAGGFEWRGCGTHPMRVAVPCATATCSGWSTLACHESGCWRSQCEDGDRDDGITCWHCPRGYVDWGAICVKKCDLYPLCSSIGISTYGLRYTIPTTDKGLLYKDPN